MKLTLFPDAKEIASRTHPAPTVSPTSAPLRPQTPATPVVAQPPPVAFLANVAKPVAALCDKAVALCRHIAPLDLAGLPIYVVPQSAIAAKFGNADATYGYIFTWLDWVLREEIGASWEGRGPCMVINDIAMRQDMPGSIEALFLSTVIHELSHVFERGMRFDSTPDISPDRVIFEQLRMAHEVKNPVPESGQARTYHQHGQRFIRAMLHLRHRAEAHGVRLAPAILFNDGPAIFATAFDYLLALQNEPERMFDASIAEILASHVPPAFERLWLKESEFLTRHSSKEMK